MADKVKFQELDPDSQELLASLYIGDHVGRFGDDGYVKYRRLKDYIDDYKNVEVRPDDVWVVTFPRSGTTFMRELVWLLNNNLDYNTALEIPMTDRFYFLERPTIGHSTNFEKYREFTRHMPSFDSMVNACSRRFIMTHLPFSLLPGKLLDTSKVVYVARDPRDVAVSNYYLQKYLKAEYLGDFKTFWNIFTRDLVPNCPYFPHVKEAWALRHHPNMLFIFYEELIKDLPAAVYRIAKFFDKKITHEQNQKLCEHLNIKNLKKNKSVNPDWMNRDLEDVDKQGFVRKGVVGGWREYFDDEMAAQAQRWMHEGLAGTDLTFLSLN